MNEHKKEFQKHVFEQKQTKQERMISELACEIKFFVSHNKLSATDWNFLGKLIKKLDSERNLSGKDIKSIRSRFEKIQMQYNKTQQNTCTENCK